MSDGRTPIEGLPNPPVDPAMDLRDFCFLPLDVVRLRDSELAAVEDAEVFRAAVIAWCVAWHQIPASSLPDDDAVLARMLGYGRDVPYWCQLRTKGALRGFSKCSDGRLYHWLVAQKACSAWEQKLKQRERTANARAAKLAHAKHVSEQNDYSKGAATECVSGSATVPVTVLATETKGEGERKGKGKEEEKKEEEETEKLTLSGNIGVASTILIPEWVPPVEWAAFLQMRQRISAPSTPRAIMLLIKRLKELNDSGEDIATALDQSVMHGWRGVFPVKKGVTRHECRKQGPGNILQAHLAGFAALVDAEEQRTDASGGPGPLALTSPRSGT